MEIKNLTSIDQLELSHLGEGATEEDLQAFRTAFDHYASNGSESLPEDCDASDVIALIWNNGDWKACVEPFYLQPEYSLEAELGEGSELYQAVKAYQDLGGFMGPVTFNQVVAEAKYLLEIGINPEGAGRLIFEKYSESESFINFIESGGKSPYRYSVNL